MENILSIAILPLICSGVITLTGVVVIFVLWRGTKAIGKQLKEQENTLAELGSGNTRWARGDLKNAPQPEQSEEPTKTCPACGGENAAGSSVCAYCGRVL
jgi:hypothetical protein